MVIRKMFRAAAFAMLFYLCLLINDSTALSSEEAPSPLHGREKREMFRAMDYLKKYGYLHSHDSYSSGSNVSQSDQLYAIKSFQAFNRLPVTGRLDDVTLEKMKSPRCGNPDKTPMGVHQASKSKWQKNILTWKPINWSTKLSRKAQMKAFTDGFALWSEVIPIEFNYSSISPDIAIMFFPSGNHGCGMAFAFDGDGGLVAHSYPPGSGEGGDIHIDEEENWSMGTGVGRDLAMVVAHEIGHALGLEHSNAPKSLMTTYYYFDSSGKPQLYQDDVTKIQRLYGVRATTTTASPTMRPVPKPSDFCKNLFRLDAFAQGGDGFMYAFRLDTVYKIGSKGLESGYPKKILEVFPGGPKRYVGAASFVPQNKKFYIFDTMNRVWRFSQVSTPNQRAAHFQLDKGHPKRFARKSRYKPSAAFTMTNKRGRSKLFIFGMRKKSIVYRLKIKGAYRVQDLKHHRRIQRFLRKAPKRPDAVFRNKKGQMLFFKNKRYIFIKANGKRVRRGRFVPDLLGAVCGGTPTIFKFGDK